MQEYLSQVVSNTYIMIVFALIIALFIYALILLIKSFNEARIFDVDNYSRSEADKYRGIKSINPYYIEQDLNSSIMQSINPKLPYIQLIVTTLPILGLLGTFIGLSGALPEMTKGDLAIGEFIDLDKIIPHITGAFYTTIVAIVFALPLSFFVRKLQSKVNCIVNDVKVKVFDLVYVKEKPLDDWNPQDFYLTISLFFKKSMDQFEQKVSDSYAELKTWSADIIRQNTQQVVENADRNMTYLQKTITLLTEERDALNKVKLHWNKSIQQLHDASSNIVSMTQNVNNFAKLTENLIERINQFSILYQNQLNYIDRLRDQVNEPSLMLENLKRAIEISINQNSQLVDIQKTTQATIQASAANISDTNKELYSQLQSAFNTFDDRLNQFREDSKTNNDRTNNELRSTIQYLVEGFSQEINKINEQQQQAVTLITDKICTQLSPLSGNIELQTEKLKSIGTAIEQLNKEPELLFQHNNETVDTIIEVITKEIIPLKNSIQSQINELNRINTNLVYSFDHLFKYGLPK